jgi:hypothetical protein
MNKIPDEVKSYLSTIGKKGGSAGKGKSKTRPDGYYAAIRQHRKTYPKWGKKNKEKLPKISV